VPFEVKLPDIGEGVAEGEIVRWFVKAGDAVKEDQPLVEVMTDKATVEIPSPRTGVIASLNAEEGQVVPVGHVIVAITVEGEAAAGAPPGAREDVTRWNDEGGAVPVAAPATGGAATTGAKPAPAAKKVQATPAVRALAKKLGVALEGISGSGPGGAVTAADVEKAANGAGAPAAAAAPVATANEERVPLRGLRRRIAEQMRRSIEKAAHFTFVAECDMTEVVAHRAKLKGKADAAGIKLTYMAYVVKALVEPLERFPLLNASLDDERGEIVLKREYHIGIATDTKEGLTVPVVHDARRLTLMETAREVQRLADAARDGKLKLDELQGGTFTVTSTGTRGGVLATPILHYPQVAILGVHEIKKRPAVVNDQIVIRDLCNLSLSLDHRVVDGAVGAEFLYAVVERLEHPDRWLTTEAVG